MCIRILLSIISLLFSTVTFAQPKQIETCTGVECFSQYNILGINNQDLVKAPKYAWRPRHYNRNTTPGYRSRSSNRYNSGWSGWFSSVPRTGPANASGTIIFDPRRSTFAAYDSNGDLVKSGRASGGMSYCDDVGRSCRTPVGRFRVYHKGPTDCVSRKYPLGEGGAPMPHCMYFHGGYALHGSYYVPNRPASHGCIRVTPANAAWLYRNFVRVGTVIRVKSY